MANNLSAPQGRGAFIGRAMPRFEDLRFVRGSGNYTDDVSLPEQSYAAFVRAPHAHARIVSIDISAARRLPGVLAVLTGEDYVGDGHVGMAHFPNPADANDVSIPTFAPTPERKILDQLQLPLALGCVLLSARRSRSPSRKAPWPRAMPPKRSSSNIRSCRR